MSYHDAMDDYDLPEPTAREVHEQVEDWLRRLDDLFAWIKAWATAHGLTVRDGEPRPMLEERMERVGEPAREQPTLILRSAEGMEIWIWPITPWVLNASGLVHVLAQKGTYELIDNAKPLDPPEWMLWKAGAGGHGRAFDPGQLAALI